MQANDGQFHEVEPAGLHATLRKASVPNDAATLETRRVPAPAEESLSEAPSVTREVDYTAVIEALMIAALHALEVHVRDVKKRIAILHERGAEGAESPAVTVGSRGTPRETPPPRCAAPQPLSYTPRRAEPPRA